MTNPITKLIEENRWRPIAEAPRDGTPIIVEGGTVEWRLPFTESTNNNGDLNGWFSHSAQRFLQWKPTHFRPLPDDRLARVTEVLLRAIEDHDSYDWTMDAIKQATAIAEGKK